MIRRNLSHILALLGLLALTTVFYRGISLTNSILVGFDTFNYFYPLESYASETLVQGRLPLWDPYLFTGAPFLANLQTAVFYPLNLIFLLLPVPRAYAYSIVLHVTLAGFFMYLFCRHSLKLDAAPAFCGAVAFMFGGFTNSLVGHINQLHAATWIPLLFLLADMAFRRRSVRVAALGGLVLALQFTAGHAQESYLTLFGLGLFLVFHLVADIPFRTAGSESKLETRQPQVQDGGEVVAPRRASGGMSSALAKVALLGIIVALGAGLAAVQLVPAYELSGLSIRAGGMSYKEAAAFSLPPSSLLKSFLPVFGDPQPFSEWLGYVGVSALALAALAIAARPRRPYVLFAAAMALIAVFFAFGQYNPLYPLAYKLVPGMNLFRVPARWLYLYTFAVSMLVALGAACLSSRASKVARRATLLRLAVIIASAAVFVVGLYLSLRGVMPLELPSLQTLSIWLGVGLVALAAVSYGLLSGRRLAHIFAALLVMELFAANQGLELDKTTLPDAYSSMRPAVAFFLADRDLYRILPISENTYDPGDTRELREMLEGTLSEQQIYDFIVAAKYKETLMPNQPLRYRIQSIDGYDGGMLPLKGFVKLKELFPLREKRAPDGRLRDELEAIPDAKLLGALNVKYVLMDRVRDAWVDGVYYDLAFTQALDPQQKSLTLNRLPKFETTSLGVVSNLNGAQEAKDGEPVAWITAIAIDGTKQTFPLRAGVETAEGRYDELSRSVGVKHAQARKAKSWKGEPDAWDYIGKVTFPKPTYVAQIEVRSAQVNGAFNLRGISLIDERTGASEPVVINNSLELEYLGDVKIYRNLDLLPRAFVVRPVTAASGLLASDVAASYPSFEIKPGQARNDGAPIAQLAQDKAEIVRYDPETVQVRADLSAPGFLVLTDSYYPGWHAFVDGVEKPILMASGLFRAVELEPGSHVVKFVYQPSSLVLGLWISLASLAAVILLFAAFLLSQTSKRATIPWVARR